MKHLRTAALLLLAAAMYACNKSDAINIREMDPVKDQKIINAIAESGETGVPFPAGSVAYHLKDGSMEVRLPEGYRYLVSLTQTGVTQELTAIKVTCDCTSGTGGCTPLKKGSDVFCVMGAQCTVCKKTVATIDAEPAVILGLYQPKLGASLLTTKSAGSTNGRFFSAAQKETRSMNSSVLRLNSVKNDLLELYHFIYGNEIPAFIMQPGIKATPSGYRYVAANIAGSIAAIPVPESFITGKNLQVFEEDLLVTDICKCNTKGASGCVKSSLLGAVYCEAGPCKSCTLIASVVDPQ